jgi:hypothetical protein
MPNQRPILLAILDADSALNLFGFDDGRVSLCITITANADNVLPCLRPGVQRLILLVALDVAEFGRKLSN